MIRAVLLFVQKPAMAEEAGSASTGGEAFPPPLHQCCRGPTVNREPASGAEDLVDVFEKLDLGITWQISDDAEVDSVGHLADVAALRHVERPAGVRM